MKTFVSLLFAVLVCAGCATRYNMTLTNGLVITAKGKPKVDEQRHIIFFTDATGKTNAIPEFRVTKIEPTSLADEDNPKFNPTAKK